MSEDILANLSMSVVSTAHRLHAAVISTANVSPYGEIEEDDPDKAILDPDMCDKVLRFIQTCDSSPSGEHKDEGIMKPSGSRQKIVYHLAPFSELFTSMIREWSRNPNICTDANFYVERVPDIDEKCSEEMDKLLVEFVVFNLTRPTERSDWCIIESPLPSATTFHSLLEHAFFKTTLTAHEIRRNRPRNGRRQTRFVMKDHRAVMSLQDTRDMLHIVCQSLGLVITDNPVFMTRTVGQRNERHKYSMHSFITGEIEKACWIDCCDYMSTFRIHLPNDPTVNAVNIYYYLEHADDIHPQFSIFFEHVLHFPVVTFNLERNVEMEFNPNSTRRFGVVTMSSHDHNEIISQMLTDLRHLVVGLTNKERTADENLNHGQSVQERIEIMKEYQEKVNDMNGSWRMQGRKHLLNGLQRENRQILALQEENRQLLMTVKEYQDTLNLIMSKHRAVVSSFKKETHLTTLLERFSDKNGTVNGEKLMRFFHALNQCMTHGERQSQRDQETIKQLRTENMLLRELLNIAEHNSDGVRSTFRSRMCESGSSSGESCTTKESSSGSSESSKRSSSERQNSVHRSAKTVNCNGTAEDSDDVTEASPLERCRSRDSCSSEDTVIYEGVPVSGV